jgi:hypothetical protein
MTTYSYVKSPVSIDRLTQEIQMSTIAPVVDHMNLFGSALDIAFRSDLTTTEKSTLDSIIAAHDGTPLTSDFNEMTSTVMTSTNSSSYVILNGMVSPPLVAGTYIILFSGTFSTTIPLLANPAIYVACFANGIIIPASAQTESNTVTGNVFNIGFNCKTVLGQNQTIDVRWKNNGVLNTVSCTTRCLDIMKIS